MMDDAEQDGLQRAPSIIQARRRARSTRRARARALIAALSIRIGQCGLTLLILACACGRIAFDAQLDALVCTLTSGHDEDGDGVDDLCDVCPHLADADQRDGDGDRVGDVCDPEPALARQTIQLFDSFVTRDPAWAQLGPSTFMADELVMNVTGASASVRRPLAHAHDTFVVGAVAGSAAPGQHLFAIMLRQSTDAALYYCEIFDDDTMALVKYTYMLGMGMPFMTAGFAPMPDRLAGGTGRLTYEIDATNVYCTASWQGTETPMSGARPPLMGDELAIYAENINIRFLYLIQIRSEP